MTQTATKPAATDGDSITVIQARLKETRAKMRANKSAAAGRTAEIADASGHKCTLKDCEHPDCTAARSKPPKPEKTPPPPRFDYESLVKATLDEAEQYLEAPMVTTTGLINIVRNLILCQRTLASGLDSIRAEFLWTQR